VAAVVIADQRFRMKGSTVSGTYRYFKEDGRGQSTRQLPGVFLVVDMSEDLRVPKGFCYREMDCMVRLERCRELLAYMDRRGLDTLVAQADKCWPVWHLDLELKTDFDSAFRQAEEDGMVFPWY
jgi:hypothetical protein